MGTHTIVCKGAPLLTILCEIQKLMSLVKLNEDMDKQRCKLLDWSSFLIEWRIMFNQFPYRPGTSDCELLSGLRVSPRLEEYLTLLYTFHNASRALYPMACNMEGWTDSTFFTINI